MLLNILVVSSEAVPLAKTGGLGDAISGMAHALHDAGVAVSLLLPAYRSTLRHVTHLRTVGILDDLPGGTAQLLAGRIVKTGVPVILLRNDTLYERDGSLYLDAHGKEYPDNGIRFAALSHAAVRIAEGRTTLPVPHVVHANDWHAGLVPMLMHARGVTNVRSVLTIHNLAFQGIFPMEQAESLGIPLEYRGADAAEYWGQLNFLKAGLLFADRITTVSHHYATEILTPRFGMGLEGVLSSRKARLSPTPNGIDPQVWNPSNDAYLPDVYSVADLAGKASCKRALQEDVGLIANPNATVMVSCSRLTSQKMGDVAAQAIPRALAAHPDLQVAVLGCGDRGIEDAMREVARQFPGRMAVHIGYDERRAHLLYAGGDILLHGSRFEPFGLAPVYAMVYATLPICSRVGGMVDTVSDPGPQAGPNAMEHATGILFDGETMEDMLAAIDRTMALRKHPQLWWSMQRNGMLSRFNWETSAHRYLDLYAQMVDAHVTVPRPFKSMIAPVASPPVKPAVNADLWSVTQRRDKKLGTGLLRARPAPSL